MPRAITMQKIEGGKPGKVYYPLEVTQHATPSLSPTSLLIQIHTVALNHRDLFLRQHLYPSPSFTTPLCADACGYVSQIGSAASKSWLGKRVILTPGRGWHSDPFGPEDAGGYKILGGTSTIPIGTLIEEVVIEQEEVEEAPAHLSDEEAAALPLCGLTGWRALVVKGGEGNMGTGKNILITGIGGGVALSVLQFAVGLGSNVFVSSGDQGKIEKAKGLGAKGGVSYKSEGWEKELKGLLKGYGKGSLDLIVDGAGGDIVRKATKLLKLGGTIVQYGMTISPKMDWSMPANLMNLELKGSTMGSRKEFREMVQFVNEHKIKPVVSKVVKGLDNLEEIEELFEDMKGGKQFGKLIIEVKGSEGGEGKGKESKL
ncbi:uncharacterized protein EAF02_010613 [Botrytis sinoallii]|uniref:uncharacterized protein n=1 Tax=Botrytis sinoallii TaxID=1463999 RepID=UPI00190282FD|nr:uncharacterized protein EAF02_010613 [Botrytis sinoallii]KAF7861659.1 hypothetical protein EAF02_010613 [Botrytis sinoallii]